MDHIVGIILAAGQGKRMGGPKALMPHPDGGTYLQRACRVLHQAGVRHIVIVLGADAQRVSNALAAAPCGLSSQGNVDVVVNHEWDKGMSSSLKTGLEYGNTLGADVRAALIHLVDLPDVSPQVITQVVDAAVITTTTLCRASYQGRPGHPVVLGRDHWQEITNTVTGDAGARHYFATHPPSLVEVGHLATGADVDTPQQRETFENRWLGEG